MTFFRYHGFSEDIEALKGQPVQYDATGRMIRSWDKKETVPVPKRKPETGIAPPAYKRSWFNKPGGMQNWKDWGRHVAFDNKLSLTEKEILMDTFAAEGGSFEKDGTTVGGITGKVLRDHKDEPYAQKLRAKYGRNVRPSDLNMHDLKESYKGYFDTIFKKVAEKHSRLNPHDRRSGSGMLDTIGDRQIARATADAIFRVGSGDGVEMAQKSINATLPPGAIREKPGTSAFGTGNFTELRGISKDPARKRIYLKTLGDLRDRDYKHEKARNGYFRFGNY